MTTARLQEELDKSTVEDKQGEVIKLAEEKATLEKQEVLDQQPAPEKTEVLDQQPIIEQTEVVAQQSAPEKQEVSDQQPIIEQTEVVAQQSAPEKTEVLDQQPIIEQTEVVVQQSALEKQEAVAQQPVPEKQEVLDQQPVIEKTEVVVQQPAPEKQEVVAQQPAPEQTEVLEKPPLPEKKAKKETIKLEEKEKLKKETPAEQKAAHVETKDDNKSPLEKHMEYLGGLDDKHHKVSQLSMERRLKSLGSDWFSAKAKSSLVSFSAGIKMSGCPFATFKPKAAVGVLNHTMSSGIYNLDGTINEDRWKELVTFAEKDNKKNDHGQLIVTESTLAAFLEYCRKQETRSDRLRIGRNASDQEWKEFFKTFSDFSFLSGKHTVHAVTLDRLRKFYENTKEVGEEIERQVRPH